MRVLVFFVICLTAIVGTSGQEGPTRIVGGSVAPAGQYPYQVSLQKKSHFCGGSIINNRWILTAAHCLIGQSAEDIRVVVGTNSLSDGGETYQADLVRHHNKFRPILLRNDIGLIRVDRDIVFNEKVQPVPLPTSDFTKKDYPATLTGWGLTTVGGVVPNDLQYIELKVISPLKCKIFHFLTTSTHICTLTRYGQGACNGDSGGPLTADGVQIGIVSFGIPCGRGWPDVFTRVWKFVDWINDTIEHNTPPPADIRRIEFNSELDTNNY